MRERVLEAGGSVPRSVIVLGLKDMVGIMGSDLWW